jgi:hypothetical protein
VWRIVAFVCLVKALKLVFEMLTALSVSSCKGMAAAVFS